MNQKEQVMLKYNGTDLYISCLVSLLRNKNLKFTDKEMIYL